MKLKSLILGSAAALVAVSGARAADAIIAEPEPVEYVRVCDAYGAGFFYIPGTETCLKIGGYIFYQIGATNDDGVGNTPNWAGMIDDEWNKYIRARVDFDARSETEWGTLRSFIRFQSDMVNSAPLADSGVNLDQAWLSLGGLLMGYTESAMFLTPNAPLTSGAGFGWYVTTYSYTQRQLIQYNFSGGNGFFATVSLENDPSVGAVVSAVDLDGDGIADDVIAAGSDANYIPDVVAKAGIQQAWGAAWAQVGVDEQSDVTGDTEYTVKAGLHLNVPNAPGSAFRLIGWYASDPNIYNTNRFGFFSSEWSVYAGYQHRFNPELAAFVGAQYFNNLFAIPAGGLPGDFDSGLDAYFVEAGVIWTPVTNFEIRSDIYYTKAETLDGSVAGFLRFTRYF